MTRSVLTALSLLAAAASPALAADSPLSFNTSVVSDYRYRGISQTRLKPALQGGADYVSPSGLYVGAWGSTIRWIKDNGVKGPVELDLYGGYRGDIRKDIGYDVGLLRYAYIGNKLSQTGGGGVYKNADTTEVYGAVTIASVTGKLSYALTNLFGYYDFTGGRKTRGSTYFELSGSYDLGSGFSLAPHVGYQRVARIANASYADYSAAITKDVGLGSLGVTLLGTNADKAIYVPGAAANSSRYLGRTSIVVSFKATF